jgi:hypothetical protein
MEREMESARLTPAELAEITAKIANELEEYQDQATDDLRSGFLKLVEACEASTEHIYVTTLMAKWADVIRRGSISGKSS